MTVEDPSAVHEATTSRLPVIDQEVAARTESIRDGRPDWPCRKGCDHCCRHLARPPVLTRAEWIRLFVALEALPGAVRAQVHARLEAVAGREDGPVTCPFLDLEAGACRVYAARPVACRTYGYFAVRREGRWCGEIQKAVERGELDDVVWGNQAALDRRLEHSDGPPIALAEWLDEYEAPTSTERR